ncbi:Coenzyme PQQ synthesis protein D (PqqD) [Epibacterium ulvae]|uniref:Coenzyme PQQ synthesis protein D (PqqD) n=1 Tax=Epibacterium ulvae TaxID=1156985 RepID=A0A1G5RDV1_9RHOB|nr:PqqD family protein [Epibacterium ulvae]SCZ71950.1 Coenzyme PQQ synthesis protein D (PqqD) [Epibacterium ulvae]
MKYFQAKATVVDADMDGDRALLDLEENTYFTLNPTASTIWAAISEPQPLQVLVAEVTEKFDVSEEECRSDVEALLQDMVAANLVNEVEA